MEFHAILKDALCDCVKYVDTVACIEASMPMIMTSFEGADLRARITALDSERRAAHEAAIAQVGYYQPGRRHGWCGTPVYWPAARTGMKLAISAMKLPPRFSQTAANKKKRPIGLFFLSLSSKV